MKKSLRNKALKDIDRLITAELDGEDWACPGGYFGTAYPIYEGYKPRKHQYVPDNKPNLKSALPSCDYAVVAKTGVSGFNQLALRSDASETIFTINQLYYDFIMDIYPDAIVKVAVSESPFLPVKFYQDDVMVAVIMPIRV